MVEQERPGRSARSGPSRTPAAAIRSTPADVELRRFEDPVNDVLVFEVVQPTALAGDGEPSDG